MRFKQLNFKYLILLYLCGSILDGGEEHRKKNENTFFPAVRFVWTPVFPDNCQGVSFLVEAGGNNYRLGGTYGYVDGGAHRFKISGEWLAQNFRYSFKEGHSANQWVQQSAGGAVYQYWFASNQYLEAVQIKGTFANSTTEHAKRREQDCGHGVVNRRIPGAGYISLEIGGVIEPWNNALLTLGAGFSEVQYNRRIHSKETLSGGSASLEFTQIFAKDWSIRLLAELKKPYNSLEGAVGHSCCFANGDLFIGLFGGHTWGKGGLRDSSRAGLEVDWSFGITGLCNCLDKPNACSAPLCCDSGDLTAWVSTPAVYMPTVLSVTESCRGPSSRTIPDLDVPAGQSFRYATASFFHDHGKHLTFSAKGLPDDATIDTNTGVITGFNPGHQQQTFSVTVKAKSKCTSAEQTFNLIYDQNG